MSQQGRSRILWLVPAAPLVAWLLTGPPVAAATPHVLRVGSYHGIRGQYVTIQAAVDRARPGDWILVGPGDHHERGSNDPDHPAGVLISTPQLHLRGMNRNTVIVDGTKSGGTPCDARPASQDFGPVKDGGALG
ncbi:MAG: hypothetical protein ABR573_01150, partial [Candidatus Dormibacteria bacterium]